MSGRDMIVKPLFGLPKVPPKSTDLFVLMPFQEDLKPVYEDHITKVATGLQLTVARADDFFTTQTIINEIWDAICSARIVIADCTDRNPNVFYEIGLAHAIGKPVILIAQDNNDVPFDLKHLRYIHYDYTPRGMRLFEDHLTKTIKAELNLGESLIDTGNVIKVAGAQIKDLPTRILFLAANPTNASWLRLDVELRTIQEKLQLASLREHFVLNSRLALRPEDLSQALLDIRPNIVQFSGHGTSAGAICLEDNLGNTKPVSPNTLASLFKLVSEDVECVMLNACYSEDQASAIVNHINFVVGMSQAISDDAAIAFSIGFYQALGSGRSVEEAYRFGCVQIELQGIPESLTPLILKKSDL
jgi:CHAT domain